MGVFLITLTSPFTLANNNSTHAMKMLKHALIRGGDRPVDEPYLHLAHVGFPHLSNESSDAELLAETMTLSGLKQTDWDAEAEAEDADDADDGAEKHQWTTTAGAIRTFFLQNSLFFFFQ